MFLWIKVIQPILLVQFSLTWVSSMACGWVGSNNNGSTFSLKDSILIWTLLTIEPCVTCPQGSGGDKKEVTHMGVGANQSCKKKTKQKWSKKDTSIVQTSTKLTKLAASSLTHAGEAYVAINAIEDVATGVSWQAAAIGKGLDTVIVWNQEMWFEMIRETILYFCCLSEIRIVFWKPFIIYGPSSWSSDGCNDHFKNDNGWKLNFRKLTSYSHLENSTTPW